MPYQWYPSSFLELPLEIRWNIYSHLLISNSMTHLIGTNIFRSNITRRTICNVFLTCRQLYDEAFAYYYSQNTFLLSLTTPYYNIIEIATNTDILQRRLNHVQRLMLHIVSDEVEGKRVIRNGDNGFSSYPPHQEKWDCVVDLLRHLTRKSGNAALKKLTVDNIGNCNRKKAPISYVPLEELEQQDQSYSQLLAPLRDCVKEIFVVQRLESKNNQSDDFLDL